MTITREQIRELAEFQDENSCAVSFYFQPSAPRNKAHKEDTILIKDLAREALRSLENKGKKRLRPCRCGPHPAPVGGVAQQRNPRQGRVRLRRSKHLAGI